MTERHEVNLVIIRQVERVFFVMQDGVIVRNDRSPK